MLLKIVLISLHLSVKLFFVTGLPTLPAVNSEGYGVSPLTLLTNNLQKNNGLSSVNNNPLFDLSKAVGNANDMIALTYSTTRQPFNKFISGILTENPLTNIFSRLLSIIGAGELPKKTGNTLANFGTNTMDTIFEMGHHFGTAATNITKQVGKMGVGLFPSLATSMFDKLPENLLQSSDQKQSGSDTTDKQGSGVNNDSKNTGNEGKENKKDEKKTEQPATTSTS